MLVRLNQLKSSVNYHFGEELKFEEKDLETISFLKEVKYAYGKLDIKDLDECIIATLSIEADLILLSTRSLKEVPFKVNDKIELTFSFNEIYKEDEQIIYLKDNEVDFNVYFLSLIGGNIPFKVISEDDEFLSGDSWEVISEDEYNKRKKDTSNSPFQGLEDLYDEEDN